MKEYRISYKLDNMLHSRIVTAENEYRAILDCLHKMPDTSSNIMHDFKIERYIQEWN